LLSVALVAPAEAKPRHSYPDRIDLPVGFQPEGITIGKGPYAYVGSLADGDIYRADLRTGEGRVISQGPGTPSVGLKIDKRGLLYVAGGPSGTARAVSARTGTILASYTLSTEPSFINDVVLTKRAAWFTNSLQPELYRVSRDGRGSRVTTLPLSGDWVQTPGFNANGIALTPDGRALLVVQSSTGTLFRVDPETGVARRVDLGGYQLVNGDGLLVRGRTLYVVQNRLEQVAVFDLNRRGTAGTLDEVLPVPDSDVPTTVAAYKGSLYLPNARFGIASPATQEYWITRIDK
jgi:sugar lactone lactonase YvrE